MFRCRKQIARLYFPGLMVLLSLLLGGCTGANPGGGALPAGTATPANVALSRLHWCEKPTMVFRDLAVATNTTPGATPGATSETTPAPGTMGGLGPANGTPTTITAWSLVKANLGFTVFLPATLPAGSCLLSASGTLRDPILGSNFTIVYLLPGKDALSLAQAPQRSQSTAFQCSASPTTSAVEATRTSTAGAAQKGTATPEPGVTQGTVQLCSGVRDKTNIVFSARGTTQTLQAFFHNLQSGVDWMPTS